MTIPRRPGPRQDDGYYGPVSLAWEVLGHPVAVIGTTQSGLYTALISEVAQAVVDHSKVFIDPVARAQETAYFQYTIVFGDRADAERAGKWVQGRHAKVKGFDPVTKTDYSPTRPDLSVNAHALIWMGYLDAYETYVREFSADERERYWLEGFTWAGLMGIDIETLPQSWTAWRAHYDSQIRPALNFSTASQQVMTVFGTFAQRVPLVARPPAHVAVESFKGWTLLTLDRHERALLGDTRSAPRAAIDRWLGRRFWELATLPPTRDALERAQGQRVHELLSEARAIQHRHRTRAHGPLAEPTEHPRSLKAA